MADNGHNSIDYTRIHAHISTADGKRELAEEFLATRGTDSPVRFTVWRIPEKDHSPST